MPAKLQKKSKTRVTPARTSEVLLAMRDKLTLSEVAERYLSMVEEPKI
jgi:hypothetical protein